MNINGELPPHLELRNCIVDILPHDHRGYYHDTRSLISVDYIRLADGNTTAYNLKLQLMRQSPLLLDADE
jgi:hypothetical protein